MNIEESDLPAAIQVGGDLIGHLHFVDSNRRAAGFGHIDFPPIVAALRAIGYAGYASAVLVDGFVRAVWKLTTQRKAATLGIEPFAELSKQKRAAVSEEGGRLLGFMAPGMAHEIRFVEL